MKISAKIIKCLLAAMLIFSSCSKENETLKKAEKKGEGVFKINTAVALGKTVQRTIEATGTLAPWEEVIVSNKTPGTVDKIFADLGDKLAEGELVMRLDQKDAKADFDNAEANLKKARAVLTDASLNLKRYSGLFQEGIASTSQRDAAQTQYDVADAQVNQAKAQFELAKKHLADTEIKSPITGYVKKRLVSAGETIKDKTPAFILVKNDPLKFQGAVPEFHAPHIAIGQDVAIHIDAFADKTFSGKIIRISPSVDETTRTFSIEAQVPNPGGILKSGFFAKGLILLKKEDNIPFIPETALYSFAGINKVYVIDNNVAKERQVKTGSREADMVEIAEGVKPGDIVAASGLDQLFDGARVEVK